MTSNTKNFDLSYSQNTYTGDTILRKFLNCLCYRNIINVVCASTPKVEISYVERFNLTELNYKTVKILCDKKISFVIDRNFLLENYQMADTIVEYEFADIMTAKISDSIYENSIKPNFRIDITDNADDVLQKLWLAAEISGDVMLPDIRNKWILPVDLAVKLFPIFRQNPKFNTELYLGDVNKLGNYRGVDIFVSYRNTVALLCYKGYDNKDSGMVFSPFIARTKQSPDGKRIEIVYGMELIEPSYFVSLQIR